ncbi:hypothetical protein VFPPC_14911 [Pochonia chlamydosporia 170]|uniref:Uncharacterized protein n=1 Tax=Pochonia chlamydosporia 170 TaxID=1380566 RepID=A0A179EXJ0_METCM|nr:hypothetical protein VFPPC_14911 [Pochonia chlamydosporia 170]OAQ57888.1 hypothetical protein VFPPC_14911 [Pochonia chlamydosporia 170]
MGLLDNPLSPFPKAPRQLMPWTKVGSARQSEDAALQAQFEQIQALLYELKTTKREIELQLLEINRLTEVNKAHMDVYCQNERWREDARDYQEALKNIMSYTLITASDCRKRSKDRQTGQWVNKPLSGEDIHIGVDCGEMNRDGSYMI